MPSSNDAMAVLQPGSIQAVLYVGLGLENRKRVAVKEQTERTASGAKRQWGRGHAEMEMDISKLVHQIRLWCFSPYLFFDPLIPGGEKNQTRTARSGTFAVCSSEALKTPHLKPLHIQSDNSLTKSLIITACFKGNNLHYSNTLVSCICSWSLPPRVSRDNFQPSRTPNHHLLSDVEPDSVPITETVPSAVLGPSIQTETESTENWDVKGPRKTSKFLPWAAWGQLTQCSFWSEKSCQVKAQETVLRPSEMLLSSTC